jgi:flagellar hook-basal body complex protein FliE
MSISNISYANNAYQAQLKVRQNVKESSNDELLSSSYGQERTIDNILAFQKKFAEAWQETRIVANNNIRTEQERPYEHMTDTFKHLRSNAASADASFKNGLHEDTLVLMEQINKMEISLGLIVATRDKFVEAYKQILNMQL